MVMFTGLWNTSQYLDRQHFHSHNNANNSSNNSKPPSTIQYGSITEATDSRIAAGTEPTNDEKPVTATWTWEHEDEAAANNDTASTEDMHAGISSTGTSSSSEQELPSLTAAFRSLENRSIVINCLWYLAIYFTVAVIAYSFVLEQWTIIDSLYFAVATL